MTTQLSTTLYSLRDCHLCQRVRMVLQEKRIPFNLEIVDGELPADVRNENHYGLLPTLKDRNLTLFFPNLIMEYLEERYPHPPLMPEVPTDRAQIRTYIEQIDCDWGSAVQKLSNPGYSRSHVLRKLREELRQSVISLAPIFNSKAYFMSGEMTLADCCALPILWRLPGLGVEIPKTRHTRAMLEYVERVQGTASFKDSLTDVEKQLMRVHPLPQVAANPPAISERDGASVPDKQPAPSRRAKK